VICGKNDPSFIAAGATAYKRDLPKADIHLLDAGDFALDEQPHKMASLMLEFVAKYAM